MSEQHQRVEVVVRDFTQPVSDDAEAMRQWCELIRLALPDPHLYPHLYRATMTKRGWSMKKDKLKALAREAEVARAAAERKASTSAAEVRKLTAELEVIRKNWRPVPTTHPWQPRDPQCALCDDTRDSPRHATPEQAANQAKSNTVRIAVACADDHDWGEPDYLETVWGVEFMAQSCQRDGCEAIHRYSPERGDLTG